MTLDEIRSMIQIQAVSVTATHLRVHGELRYSAMVEATVTTGVANAAVRAEAEKQVKAVVLNKLYWDRRKELSRLTNLIRAYLPPEAYRACTELEEALEHCSPVDSVPESTPIIKAIFVSLDGLHFTSTEDYRTSGGVAQYVNRVCSQNCFKSDDTILLSRTYQLSGYKVGMIPVYIELPIAPPKQLSVDELVEAIDQTMKL